MTNVSLEQWVVPFTLPSYLLKNYRAQFESEFFASIYRYFDVEQFIFTVYNQQTNCQA